MISGRTIIETIVQETSCDLRSRDTTGNGVLEAPAIHESSLQNEILWCAGRS
jgi:hypothetical protein